MASNEEMAKNTPLHVDAEIGNLVDENLNCISCTESSLLPSVPFKTKLYRSLQQHIYLFPLCGACLIPLLCVTIYIASLYYHHVEPIFPFISDTGTTAPEAGYFSMILDIIAIVTLISGYARYRQIKYYLTHLSDSKQNVELLNQDFLNRFARRNFIAWLLVAGAMLGFVIVGNFRSGELIFNHLLGVSLAFGCIFVYGCLMVHMCAQLSRLFNIESKPISMSIILAVAVGALLILTVFVILSLVEAGYTNIVDTEFRLHMSPGQPGYRSHIVSTFFEWICINACAVFMLCLFRRMKRFQHWPQTFG